MQKKTMWLVIAIVIIGGIILMNNINKNKKSETEKTQQSLEKVKVQAGWLLNGEYANVCSAIINGDYKKENLDVELIPGGPVGASFIISTNTIAQNNDLTLGIDGDIVPLLRGRTKENKDERLKVKAFAAFWNENPYGFIVRDDSPLKSLKDFATKRKPDGSKYKIGITADSVIQNAIAEYAGVSVKDLELVTVGFDATPFLTKQVDALAAYWTTQAYDVEKAGVKYRFLSASELPGFSQPSQIAIATEKNLIEKHDVLVKWLRATIEGSKFVINNPDEAAKQILDSRCGGQNFNEAQEGWLIKKSLTLFDKEKIGTMSKKQFNNFANAYYKLKQIPQMPEIDEMADFSVLNEIYK